MAARDAPPPVTAQLRWSRAGETRRGTDLPPGGTHVSGIVPSQATNWA